MRNYKQRKSGETTTASLTQLDNSHIMANRLLALPYHFRYDFLA